MKRRSFIVRAWMDDEGQLRGQISDPFSEWRQPFRSAAELWAEIRQLFADASRLPGTDRQQADVSAFEEPT